MAMSLAKQIEPILRSKGIDPEDVEGIAFDAGESSRVGRPVIVVKLAPRIELIQVELVVPPPEAD